jgi:hypothetical protein
MFSQSTGGGVQVATQIRGEVCGFVALSAVDEVESEFDWDEPVWVGVLDDEPLCTEVEPAGGGGVGDFGVGALTDGLPEGGARTGVSAKSCPDGRDTHFATCCSTLEFTAVLGGATVGWFAEDLVSFAMAFTTRPKFESAAVAPCMDGAFVPTDTLRSGPSGSNAERPFK